MTPKPSSFTSYKVRLVWTGAFLSPVVGAELFLRFFCGAFPLVVYLIAVALGAGLGPRLQRPTSGPSLGAKVVRHSAVGLALFAALGIAGLWSMPVRWDTKCSWRYCARAMGPGLFRSPFPVGTPSCRGWSVCANEYPYSPAEYNDALDQIRAQGCPAP